MQKKLLLTLALTLTLSQLNAQETLDTTQKLPVKIGYTNVEYIFSFLPEAKRIASELESYERQLRNQLEAKQRVLQEKFKAFQQAQMSMTEAVRNQKGRELLELENSLKQQEQEAREKLSNKQASLLKPVYEKIQRIIEQVAEEEGYTYIVNASLGGVPVLLYASEEYNISDRVLQKLNVDPNKEETAEKGQESKKKKKKGSKGKKANPL